MNRKDSYDVRLNPFGDDDLDGEEFTESDAQPASSVSAGSTALSTDADAAAATATAVTESAAPPPRVPLPSTKMSASTAY